jgi:hypothetical protein
LSLVFCVILRMGALIGTRLRAHPFPWRHIGVLRRAYFMKSPIFVLAAQLAQKLTFGDYLYLFVGC